MKEKPAAQLIRPKFRSLVRRWDGMIHDFAADRIARRRVAMPSWQAGCALHLLRVSVQKAAIEI